MSDRDKVILGVVLALLGWLASQVYDSIREKIEDNRETINALVDLHMK